MRSVRLLMLAALPFGLHGCATTQTMHFAEFSSTDAALRGIPTLNLTEPVSLGGVSVGDYSSHTEFSDYSWHAVWQAKYEGFNKLPYPDLNRTARDWASDVLASNALLSSSSNKKLDIFVRRIKLKSQQDPNYNYRACVVEIKLTLTDSRSGAQTLSVVEGLAKLRGSDINLVSTAERRVRVSFGADTPTVCKLAMINALRQPKAKS
jgi:hypothetical protein